MGMRKTALSGIFIISGFLTIQAQSSTASSSSNSFWIVLIVVVLAALGLLGDLFYRKGSKAPSYVGGGKFVGLQKGFNLNVQGAANAKVVEATASRFAVIPPNFRGISPIPKMEVNEGDEVKAGDPLFHDKNDESIKYVAPVSGEVIAINRGEKRSIAEIVILADKDQKYRALPALDLQKADRASLVSHLKASGFWPLINISGRFNLLSRATILSTQLACLLPIGDISMIFPSISSTRSSSSRMPASAIL